ncbi:purine/pyrimidine permease [Brevibacillus laterosporus]|uniref:purine/pyrimidine permease n=1 Tax=Brevibacillus laterosporus TaxID=1465 RepID=UPI00036BCF35|nr:purine/pyrimidine permease [Brevibacillus laterosporus]ATO50072.1 permease [Brevibacillus laterosporus DSM 25]MED2005414.1 purine/pyrimidine permease [Brevibacillus laterosporus]
MKYGLNSTPPWKVTIPAAVQWFIVTLSCSIAVPIVIGEVYGLSEVQTALFIQQTLFYIGLASLIQAWIGHRYPMMEAPAGLWWSIFLMLAQIGATMGLAPMEIGQSFQVGMVISGLIFLILGLTRSISKLQKLFTPAVTGTYMILLAISLASNFIKGMLGVGYHGATTVLPNIALTSIVIIMIVLLCQKIKAVASFAVLIGMLAGWGTYALMGWTDPIRESTALITVPRLFFWGPFHWDLGIVVTCVLTTLILLTNLITSIAVIGETTEEKAEKRHFDKGGVFTGVSHLISGLAGVVGMIPLTLAAAFIQTTKIASRLPFILAMTFMMIIGLLPSISNILATLPTPVAYAAMFVAYAQILGFGLRDFKKVPFNERTIIVVGCSLLLGLGIMFVAPDAWKTLHPMLSFLCSNGLLVGVLLVLLLEHIIYPNRAVQTVDIKKDESAS